MDHYLPDLRPLQAIVFDLDGTLVDTLPDIGQALNRVLAEEARPRLATPAIAPMVGDGAARLIERAFAATGPALDADACAALTQRFLALYSAEISGRSVAYPGVVEVLEALCAKGLHLGICTNKPLAPSRTLLADLDLARFFPTVIGGDSLAVKKPDGRHLLATVADLGASCETAVMVGDNANDVDAARAARLPVILVSYGYTTTPTRTLGADAVIDEFGELEKALSRIAAGVRRRVGT